MAEQNYHFSENVIIIDAAFLDTLLDDFKRNFESMIHRPIPNLDLCHWLDCLLLDAGVEAGEHDTFVAFIHPLGSKGLQHVTPGNYKEDLTDKAFADRFGEFTLGSYPVEKITTISEFMCDSMKAAMQSEQTRHILLIGDMEAYGSAICKIASEETKAIVTLFSMTAQPLGKYQQQILGYSVMSALGIRAEELV